MNDSGISRFLKEHTEDYPKALEEIKAGRKATHWMWYIFPQLRGLGQSRRSWKFGIRDADEARRYLSHPILGPHLLEITEELLRLDESDPANILGRIDAVKLRSSMTLFAEISPEGSVFHKALEKFFGGEKDNATLSLLRGRLLVINSH